MSTLERLLVLSQSSFNSERLADKCCEVRSFMDSKRELYIGMQPFTEFLLLAWVGADVIFSIAG